MLCLSKLFLLLHNWWFILSRLCNDMFIFNNVKGFTLSPNFSVDAYTSFTISLKESWSAIGMHFNVLQDTYPYFLSAGSTLSLAQFLSAIMCQNHLPEHRKWRLISHWSKEPSAMWHTLFQLICDSMADPVGIRENECVSKGLLASSIHTHNTHTALKKNVSDLFLSLFSSPHTVVC